MSAKLELCPAPPPPEDSEIVTVGGWVSEDAVVSESGNSDLHLAHTQALHVSKLYSILHFSKLYASPQLSQQSRHAHFDLLEKSVHPFALFTHVSLHAAQQGMVFGQLSH